MMNYPSVEQAKKNLKEKFTDKIYRTLCRLNTYKYFDCLLAFNKYLRHAIICLWKSYLNTNSCESIPSAYLYNLHILLSIWFIYLHLIFFHLLYCMTYHELDESWLIFLRIRQTKNSELLLAVCLSVCSDFV